MADPTISNRNLGFGLLGGAAMGATGFTPVGAAVMSIAYGYLTYAAHQAAPVHVPGVPSPPPANQIVANTGILLVGWLLGRVLLPPPQSRMPALERSTAGTTQR